MTIKSPKPHSKKAAVSDAQSIHTLFAELEHANGYPAGLIDSVWVRESQRGTDWKSPAGAKGHFQFMPATRREMIRNHGLDPWSKDVTIAARCFAIHYHEQTERFGGDVEKGLAAYVAGGGNVRKAIRNHGDAWLSSMSHQARHYGKDILARIGMDDAVALNTHDIKAQYIAQQWAAEHPPVLAEAPKPPAKIPLSEQAVALFSKIVSAFDFSALAQPLPAPPPAVASAAILPLVPKSVLSQTADFNQLLKSHPMVPSAQQADHNSIDVPQLPRKQKPAQMAAIPKT